MMILVAVALAFSGDECPAQCGGCSEGSEGSEISGAANDEGSSGSEGETEEGMDAEVRSEGENVDRVGVMEPGQSYDENTGMPDVVKSDEGADII